MYRCTACRLHTYVHPSIHTHIRIYMQPPEQYCRGHCYIRPWGYWALKVVEGRSRKKIRVEKDFQIEMSWTLIYWWLIQQLRFHSTTFPAHTTPLIVHPSAQSLFTHHSPHIPQTGAWRTSFWRQSVWEQTQAWRYSRWQYWDNETPALGWCHANFQLQAGREENRLQ